MLAAADIGYIWLYDLSWLVIIDLVKMLNTLGARAAAFTKQRQRESHERRLVTEGKVSEGAMLAMFSPAHLVAAANPDIATPPRRAVAALPRRAATAVPPHCCAALTRDSTISTCLAHLHQSPCSWCFCCLQFSIVKKILALVFGLLISTPFTGC